MAPQAELDTAGVARAVRRSITNVAVIINPVSCPNGVEARKNEIIPVLQERGWQVQVYETCAPEGALPEAKRAVEAGADLIIVAGGDGTVMEAMNALIGTEIPIAIVPAGTGNLLALNLGIPWDTPRALEIALTGEPKPIDLVQVDNGKKYFAIMGGVGYDAKIMEETDRKTKQKIGRLAYIWTALKNLRGQRFPVTLSIDGAKATRQMAKSVLVANMGQILPKIKVFPEARPDDGLIEVGVLKASTVGDFLRLTFRAILGRPAEDPAFDAYQAHEISLTLHRKEPLQLDGDPITEVRRLDLKVAPGAIHVMMPRPDQAS